MVHQWVIGVLFIFGHSEAKEGILDVVWHRQCDCFCDSVVRSVDAEVFGTCEVGGDGVVLSESGAEIVPVFSISYLILKSSTTRAKVMLRVSCLNK
jgi:hypothetical protein